MTGLQDDRVPTVPSLGGNVNLEQVRATKNHGKESEVGPITLFDKSVLQALSVNESVWFDNFFNPVISPLFYAETLADLEKAVRAGRTPEEEVGLIATKTPEMSSSPTVFHAELCLAELQGYQVPIRRVPIRSGGKSVRAHNRAGVAFDVSPEAAAFARWQEGEFLEVEQKFARVWREMLAVLDFTEAYQLLTSLGIDPGTCRSLEEAKEQAQSFVHKGDRPFEVMKLAFALLNIRQDLAGPVLKRYKLAGYPPLARFAPYSAYVLTIDVFFYIAVAASLISGKRVTNKVDLAYLYYLPFCMIFTSSDKLHKRCAPLFLSNDQEFIWGNDLKRELKKLDHHYDKLPVSEKEKGLYAFADYPPQDENFLVTRLWDRYLPRWRTNLEETVPRDNETDAKLVAYLNEFTQAEPLTKEQVDFDPSEVDTVSINRRIRRRRGKWWQVSKDLESDE